MGGIMATLFTRAADQFRWMLAATSGATAVEYALLATVLALSIIAGVVLIGAAAVDLLTIPTDVFSNAAG